MKPFVASRPVEVELDPWTVPATLDRDDLAAAVDLAQRVCRKLGLPPVRLRVGTVAAGHVAEYRGGDTIVLDPEAMAAACGTGRPEVLALTLHELSHHAGGCHDGGVSTPGWRWACNAVAEAAFDVEDQHAGPSWPLDTPSPVWSAIYDL